MTLKERIQADFMEAFKAKDMARKNFLGLLKGEIQNEEGRGTVATDVVVMTILKKMEKSLKQTNSEESLVELGFIEPYLPTMMTEEQIVTAIKEIVAGGANNIGSIMGSFSKNYTGQADNAVVSRLAKEILA
jgi:uncharacterized protein YqeY